MELRIKTKGIMISSWINGNKGNIILAPGLPQYIDKYHPLVKQAERLGLNLFVPKYCGTYESDGKFSVKNSIKTIEATVKLVKTGKAKELYANEEIKWNTKNTILMGFSFGALPSILQKKIVEKIVLICPFLFSEFHIGKKCLGEDISKTFQFLERAYTNIYRINSKNLIKELANTKVPVKKEKMIFIFGKDDIVIPEEEKSKIKDYYKNSKIFLKEGGHSVSMEDNFMATLCNLKK